MNAECVTEESSMAAQTIRCTLSEGIANIPDWRKAGLSARNLWSQASRHGHFGDAVCIYDNCMASNASTRLRCHTGVTGSTVRRAQLSG